MSGGVGLTVAAPVARLVQYKHNVEQRAKHAAEPQRFLESEIELDEAVKAMLVRMGAQF